MINKAPHKQQGFPNTSKPDQQHALLEECFWHWGEKFPLDQNCLDLLGSFLDDIIKQLPTLTYNDSTSALESFHRCCLKYMSKTLAYTDEAIDAAAPTPPSTGPTGPGGTKRAHGKRSSCAST